MFGTLVETEGGGERRWGRITGRRRLRGFADVEYEEDMVGDVQHGNLRGFGDAEIEEFEEDPVGDAMHANLRGFARFAGRRQLRGFGEEAPTMVFDSEGNLVTGDTPTVTGNTSSTVDDVLKAIAGAAPGILNVVAAAINRGAQPSSNNSCPAGYAYYSPIVKRCFLSPGEMSTAEQLFTQAQQQSGGGMNTALLVGAGVLGLGALMLFLKK